MRIFPDASPEHPIHLSCACGRKLVLTAPPETWPLPCPDCGEPVRIVDPETVARPGAEATKLLGSPEGDALPARAPVGALRRVTDDAEIPGFIEDGEEVEIETRTFTGRRRRERVVVRPPETFGAETLALAFWLAAVLAVAVGHVLVTGSNYTAGSLLVTSLLFAAVTTAFILFQGSTVGPALRAPRSGPFWTAVGAGGIPVTVTFVFLYQAAIRGLGGGGVTGPRDTVLGDPRASLPVLVLAVGILPGIFEELGFRGWMQSVWRRDLTPNRAIVLTACAFAVVHFSWYGIGWLLPMGLYLCWLRERSGSVWPGVIAHAGHNTAVVLAARLLAG